MVCPNCGNAKPKKIYLAGKSFEEAQIKACNKCSKREEDKE